MDDANHYTNDEVRSENSEGRNEVIESTEKIYMKNDVYILYNIT